MAEKAKPWSKSWRETWRDEAGEALDMCATLVRQFLAQHVGVVDEAGTGWATTREGRPLTVAAIARPCKATLEQATTALQQLIEAGIVVERDSSWGTLGWRTTQEDPEAKRKREYRERRAAEDAGRDNGGTRTPNVPGHVPSDVPDKTQQRTEDRGQRTDSSPPCVAGERAEMPPHPAVPQPAKSDLGGPSIGERLQRARASLGMLRPTQIAERADIPRGTYAQFEADELLPTRAQLLRLAVALGDPKIADWPLPERDEDLVRELVELHRRLGVELGAVDPDAPVSRPPSAHEVGEVYSTAAGDAEAGLALSEAWRRVITRAAEQLRRELARGRTRGREFFTLKSLAGPRRRELLAAVDLDRRDEGPPPARGSPARRRGPEPPQNDDALPGRIRE